MVIILSQNIILEGQFIEGIKILDPQPLEHSNSRKIISRPYQPSRRYGLPTVRYQQTIKLYVPLLQVSFNLQQVSLRHRDSLVLSTPLLDCPVFSTPAWVRPAPQSLHHVVDLVVK